MAILLTRCFRSIRLEHVFESELSELLDGLDAALHRLAGLDLTRLDAPALASAFQRLETHSRRRDSLEHGVVRELDLRHVALEAGCRNTASFLRGLSNIAPSDAKRRVDAAQNLAPGRTLTGETLEPIYPSVAAAQADGQLSDAHARVITACIDKLPDAVAADYDRIIERDLVEHAKVLDPRQLAAAAHRIAYLHDQDGVLADEAYRDRHRALTIAQRVDGSAHIQGELTAPCAEALLTMLDSLAAPRPGNRRRQRHPHPRRTQPRRPARRTQPAPGRRRTPQYGRRQRHHPAHHHRRPTPPTGPRHRRSRRRARG